MLACLPRVKKEACSASFTCIKKELGVTSGSLASIKKEFGVYLLLRRKRDVSSRTPRFSWSTKLQTSGGASYLASSGSCHT
jgi:hypothetical protein